MKNLFSLFRHHCERKPESIFFHSRYGDISYEVADRIIQKFAESLLRNDVIDTRVVAISYSNPDILFFTIWACIRTNITLVMLPPLKDHSYIAEILEQTGASYLVSDLPELLPLSRDINFENIVRKGIEGQQRNIPHIEDNGDEDAAFIFHTSGTTGIPKLVRIEYAQFLNALICLHENKLMPHTINQTAYIVPPLFHSYGLSSMLEYTQGGSAIKLPAGVNFLDSVKDLTTKNAHVGITAIEGVPYFYHYLSLLLPKLTLTNLKHIGFGGDAVSKDLILKLKEKFPGVSFSIRYGLTETPSVVSISVIQPPYDGIERGGVILPIYELRTKPGISATDFRIFIKGPCVGTYINSHDDNDGWFETGDIGYIKDNRLFITGRESTFIKNRGYRISPAVIESIILNHKGVRDCVVYSHNGDLTARITTDDQESSLKERILETLNAKLPDYYVPKYILVCDEIPRTISGKIVRRAFS